MPSLNTKLATAANTSANYVLKATSSTTIGNSIIQDNGTSVGVNTGANTLVAQFTSYSTSQSNQIKAAGTAPGITFSDGTNTVTYGGALGVATASNNFITGAIAGDMAISNQSFTAGNILFGIGTSEKMRINSSGNILINTTSDSGYKLDVNGTGRFSGALMAQSTGANIISKNTTTSQANLIRYDNSSGTARAYLGYETGGSQFYIENTEGLIYNYVSGGLALTLNADKSATFSSSVTVGAKTYIPSFTSGGALYMQGTSGQTAARYWYLGNDVVNYGDLAFGVSAANSDASYSAKVVFSSSGNVGIGTTSPSTTLDVRSSGEGIYVARIAGAVDYGAHVRMQKARGSVTSPSIVSNGDTLATLTFEAYNGTSYFETTGIRAIVNGTVTTSSIPTDLYFSTGASGTTAANERMRITSGGNVGIGGAANINDKLDVYGFLRASVNTSYFTTFGYSGGTLIRMVSPSAETADNMVFKIDGASSSTTGNQFIFQTQAGNTTPVTTLWINKLGDVSIGTTTSTKYQVLNLINDANTAGAAIGLARSSGQFITNAGAGDLVIGNATGKNILFGNTGAGTTEYARISSAGDVYIGGNTSLSSGALIVGDNSSTRPIVIRGQGGVDGTYKTGIAFYPWNTSEQNLIMSTVSGSPSASGFQFRVSDGYSSTNTTASFYINRTSCTVVGSLSKGSGSFKINHPLDSMSETHHLVHSFVESPQANNIYRGKVQLQNGIAQVNLDEVSAMTDGTFVLLNREIHTYTSNETGWDSVRGKVEGNILYIECQNNQSDAIVSWLVIGERQDKHMYETDWTDNNGKVIVEPLKETN